MSRLARWARSPLDDLAHLPLPEDDHPAGVLKARFGRVRLRDADRTDIPLTVPRPRLLHMLPTLADDPRHGASRVSVVRRRGR
ncbi:MAG: hypothetical protein ACRDQY_20630 [Pseudonocardiaceae bacterium]